MSPAAVSKAVQTLEGALGLTLMTRSARAVALTREGETFFERCRAAVAAMRGAREGIESARKQPEGDLTVSVPFIAVPLVVRALGLLHARYPLLKFTVLTTDRLSKLDEESVDVAVRIGVLQDSRLVARALRPTELWTIAAPDYLARRGSPKKVEELEGHDCLAGIPPDGASRMAGTTTSRGQGVYRSLDGGGTWQFMGLGNSVTIGRIVIDPFDPQRVFVAAMGSYFSPTPERGLYRTSDGGLSWQRVLAVSDSAGAIDVVIDPTNSQRMLAATWERVRRPNGGTHLFGPGSGIWRSLDGGTTWTKLGAAQGLPNPATTSVGRIGLALSRSQPNVAYA